MATWEPVNYYYSGQGVVLIGERDSTGKPKGLLPVGNVSDLKIAVATSVLEHKESMTGARGIDLRLTTETKATLSMTLENFNNNNLALALRGTASLNPGGTATAEVLKLYAGAVVPLAHANLTSITNVKSGAAAGTPVTLTAYTNDTTPWDYKVNLGSGSILLNDGSGAATAPNLFATALGGGIAAASLTVGDTTTFTFASFPSIAKTAGTNSKVMVQGCTGADAALLNGKAFEMVSYNETAKTVTLNVNTTGKTITGTPFLGFGGTEGQATYVYGVSNQVDALTVGAQERYLRFEGLNTADNNMPVIIEVFKFLVDPLRELALISDNIGQFVLEGNVLADSLQSSGSKYFKQIIVR